MFAEPLQIGPARLKLSFSGMMNENMAGIYRYYVSSQSSDGKAACLTHTPLALRKRRISSLLTIRTKLQHGYHADVLDECSHCFPVLRSSCSKSPVQSYPVLSRYARGAHMIYFPYKSAQFVFIRLTRTCLLSKRAYPMGSKRSSLLPRR